MTADSKIRLAVDQIDISYGKTQIVHQLSFNLYEGDIGCLLGPSGCGKTTVLLAIAGFLNPTSGEIAINDEVMCNAQGIVPPEKRNIGMVFQDYALFPNLSVSDNICFGIKHWSTEQQKQRLTELLDLVAMAELADAYPHQLSGGQQQRVALARALAPKPTLLLLDEPFSNLDVELREQLAREVRHILQQEGISAILVTHDQHEAFAMADDICVMDKGIIQQQGSANDLYHQPANEFVANFIGEGVLLSATVSEQNTLTTALGELGYSYLAEPEAGGHIDLLIRPEHVTIDSNGPFTAVVRERVFRGSHHLYTLEFADGTQLLSLQAGTVIHDKNSQVRVSLQMDSISAVSTDAKAH